MKKLHFLWLAVAFSVLFLTDAGAVHKPSTERGDPNYRRKTNIDGNSIRTTIFNYCFTGRTGVVPDEVPYEWPKNTQRMYIALNAVFFAGEVTTKTAGGADTVIRIVDVPNYRQSPVGQTWNLEPVGGYFNQRANKLAKSDEPVTWPTEWPDKATDPVDPGWKGSWNGYFGKNQFNADQEIYYKSSDDRYSRYNYMPDTTDPGRRGLGLIIDSRVMEWSQILVNKVVYMIYNVQNDGTKDIPKFGINIWLADLVGGDGDSGDDHAYFDLRNSVAWSTDSDNRGNRYYGTDKVGVAGTTYLETPGNAVDRIDNDGDGETSGPTLPQAWLAGENAIDGIDNNSNGIIDENISYVSFGTGAFRQQPVTYADGIDNNANAESGSPLVTQAIVDAAGTDPATGASPSWRRWPSSPETDSLQRGLNGRPIIHLINVDAEDVNRPFKDNIDNDGNCTDSLPTVTAAMVAQASTDRWRRYRVPGTNVVLYDLDAADVGKKYLNQDGLRSIGIDEGIDEMVDESREDNVDNNNDWNPIYDDVGLDGLAGTGDTGENDGKPTTGVGTDFPGEPNIDKTDIKESDQIGLTRVRYLAAGAINFNTTADIYFWATFFIPVTSEGEFYNPALTLNGDYDLFVSSGLFPMKSGQIERISTAVVIGVDTADVLRHRFYAQQTYNENYQFAKAPLQPTLTAIPGDKKVTLYWDDLSEKSRDSYLEALGALAPGETNFEGYRIYRATDPAFLDVFKITDKDGNPVYYKPIAIFDKVNGIKGIDSIGINGAHFDRGNDVGLVHTFIDSGLQNGQTYYYAIRGYSRGAERYGIGPSESILPISLDADGTIRYGQSVQVVIPNAPAAGFVPSTLGEITRVQGSTTGLVTYSVVDPTKVIDGRRYRITFEDTLLKGNSSTAPDTLTTKVFTLANVTDPATPETLIARSRQLRATDELPMIDGFRLRFQNERFIELNAARSGWSNPNIVRFLMDPFSRQFTRGQRKPSNYKIIIGDVGIDTAVALTAGTLRLPAKPVNYKIINTSENRQIKTSFWELVGSDGKLDVNQSESDLIIFREYGPNDSLVLTWALKLVYDPARMMPAAGDSATAIVNQPFLTADVFEFTAAKQKIDATKAVTDLDKIKVVPNPFLVAASWDPRSPFSSGPAPHAIHFNHLPNKCTIRIYTVNGELVATIDHDAPFLNGSESWDLLTRDRLPAAYGIYLYHIDAPGIGEKTGKFAIIK